MEKNEVKSVPNEGVKKNTVKRLRNRLDERKDARREKKEWSISEKVRGSTERKTNQLTQLDREKSFGWELATTVTSYPKRMLSREGVLH